MATYAETKARLEAREPAMCTRCERVFKPFVLKPILCKSCYQILRRYPNATKRGTPEYTELMRTVAKGHAQRREASPKWTGGRFVDQTGYVRLIRPEGYEGKCTHGGRYVAEHRYVAETQILGRLLLPGEIVHHINHDRTDNRPENLQVFGSVSEHRRHHVEVDPLHRKPSRSAAHPSEPA